MGETCYSVSATSKLLDMQSHVLRYWEEELSLPIGRNEMGHRYYTCRDIQVFLSIKELKKKGYSLKEIAGLMPFFYPEDKTEQKFPPQFFEILDRLVKKRIEELHSGEERYKRLDEKIRICQQSRKEVAAAIEKEHRVNRKWFTKKIKM